MKPGSPIAFAPRSLAGRLTLLQQGLAGAVIVAFAASSLWLTHRALRAEETAFVEATARRLADDVDRELAEQGTIPAAAAAVLAEESVSGVRIDVYDAAGRLVGSSARGVGVGRVAAGRAGARESMQLARARAACGAVVEASISTRLREASLAALARALLLAALPILVLSLALSRWTVRRTLEPLAAMTRRAREASIDQGVRTLGPGAGVEETDRLGESFDRLLGRLDDLLESERRFTSDASHELRTPLTVLSGEIEMALAEPSLPPAVRDNLERAAEQARAMNELVDALLLLRRVSATAPGAAPGEEQGFVPVNLGAIAQEAVDDFRMRHPGRAADLSASLADEVLVAGHPVLLAAALRNLLDNALKFTRPGEAVRLRLAAGPARAALTVEDGGRGLAEGEVARVFDPFYRGAEARASHGGFGLGLPLLNRVARAHGGDVEAGRSELGGARFALLLQRWVGPRPNAAGTDSGDAAAGRGERG